MKLDKLQKRILIFLLVLCIATPLGILLPVYFNAGDAWGEWSAQTMNELIGYVPHGLTKYSEASHSPLTDYTMNAGDKSVVHQSGYYIVCGVLGATIAYVVMLIISRLIIRDGK